MSSSEPLNFGRKIKELKRVNKKGYAELSAGLKISRERIQQLEENEREPNEVERRRFAAFYSLPVEEFGISESGLPVTPPPAPRPAPTSYPDTEQRRSDGPPPSYQEREQRPGSYQSGERNFQERGGEPRPNNYPPGEREQRPGGFQGERRPGGFQDREQRPGGFQGERRPGGFQQGGGARPGPGGPGGVRPGPGGARPGPGANPSSRPEQAQPRREQAAEPKESKEPREPKEPKSTENKPIMKYTAEQLGDIESAYLRKQRDLKVVLTFTFLNGKDYTGVVTDFTPFTIHIQEAETGQEVILRKLAMAYYRKAEAATPPRPSVAAATNDEKATGEES